MTKSCKAGSFLFALLFPIWHDEYRLGNNSQNDLTPEEFRGDACEPNLETCKRAAVVTGNGTLFRRTACRDREKELRRKV